MVSIEVYETYAREQHNQLIKTAQASRHLRKRDRSANSSSQNLLRLISRLQQRLPVFSRSASGKVRRESKPKSRIALG